MSETPEGFPVLLTGFQVAQLFNVDVKTVSRWGRSGRLTAIRTPGGHMRYFESEVVEFLSKWVTPDSP